MRGAEEKRRRRRMRSEGSEMSQMVQGQGSAAAAAPPPTLHHHPPSRATTPPVTNVASDAGEGERGGKTGGEETARARNGSRGFADCIGRLYRSRRCFDRIKTGINP